MCAALLKMKKRATISFTRSKDWCQLHTLVHAPILRKYGFTGLLHVSAKFRGPRACAALSGTCAIGTSALTWWSLLGLSFSFSTMLHTSAALVILTNCAVAYAGRIYRLLECAQLCMTTIDPHLCFTPHC